MTLDEAIAHAREQGEKANCKKCKLEHLQLAGWLEDYKRLKYEKFTPSESFVYIAALRYSFDRLNGSFMNVSKEIIYHAKQFQTWQLEQFIKEVDEALLWNENTKHLAGWARENALDIARFKEALSKEIEARGQERARKGKYD